MNFFRTEKFGSKFGDTDDLGMAWGRASFRQYFKAIAIKKKVDNNSRSIVELDVTEIGVRYIDSFDFADCDYCLPIPSSDQPLGGWKYDLNNPSLPSTDPIAPDGWYSLFDSDFINFKTKTSFGNNFNSYTPMRVLQTKPISKKIILSLD